MNELIEKLSSFVDEQCVKPKNNGAQSQLYEENISKRVSEKILEVAEESSKSIPHTNMQKVMKELYKDDDQIEKSIDTPKIK